MFVAEKGADAQPMLINVIRKDDNFFKSEINNKSYFVRTVDLNGHVVSFTT